VASWKTVRELALALPEVEADERQDGRPAFRVRGKGFAWRARERDGGGLAVRVDPDEKLLILESKPDVYFDPPHYRGFPAVNIRIEKIGRKELRERIEDAWLIRAPKRLADEFVSGFRAPGAR
jgi:hypothetical protein